MRRSCGSSRPPQTPPPAAVVAVAATAVGGVAVGTEKEQQVTLEPVVLLQTPSKVPPLDHLPLAIPGLQLIRGETFSSGKHVLQCQLIKEEVVWLLGCLLPWMPLL